MGVGGRAEGDTTQQTRHGAHVPLLCCSIQSALQVGLSPGPHTLPKQEQQLEGIHISPLGCNHQRGHGH